MKRIKKYLYIVTSMALVFIGTSCEKFLDVNQNLDDPTAVSVSTLLTAAEVNIGSNFAWGTTLGNSLAVYTHQMTGRVSADSYGLTGPSIGWNGLYSTLANLDVIIAQATEEDRLAYAGVAKILKAYTFSMMVDVWGDLPYTEFNKFKEGISMPKFDKDADIYAQLYSLVNEGIADIDNTTPNPSKPGADDLIYKGNLTNWKKAANTLKLKMLNNQRLIKNVSAEVTALLSNPAGLINSHAESFMLPFGPNAATDDRSPAYADYLATQRGSMTISPWFYETLKGRNKGILTGIEDPRIPYYIYNQKTATGTPENATDYRDGAFITITFGSKGPNRDGSNSNTYSMFGIYPVGGRYDDGAALSISTSGVPAATAGTGAVPQKFITYTDRLLIEAELINAGVVSGDEKAIFAKGLTAAIDQVDYIIRNFIKPNQTVPVLATQAAATSYITSVLDAFDKASPSKRLEHIMTQKWIANVGNSIDNYTDYRRTKYPVMFDPNNPEHAPGGFIQPPVDGNPLVNPQLPVPVSVGVPYPLSLPWPQAELDINGNAPSQKSPATYKIFWQP